MTDFCHFQSRHTPTYTGHAKIRKIAEARALTYGVAVAHRYAFTVSAAQAGLRLDQAIAHGVEALSRTQARGAISRGGAFVENKRVKIAGRIVRQGQHVVVHFEPPGEKAPRVEGGELSLIAITDSYVVVEKPSGLDAAPSLVSDQHDVLCLLAKQLQNSGQPDSLYLVHRLDRPTSGLMILARTKEAAAHLSAQAQAHSMRREYLALLCGSLTQEETVCVPIEEREAETLFIPIEQKGPLSLVRAVLRTGRTHQVRIHAEALSAPIVGDSKYGRMRQREILRSLAERFESRPPRLGLHATKLTFVDPETSHLRECESPLPSDLEKWWGQMGPPLKF